MGLKIRKYGAASVPQPATHCQFSWFWAMSPSRRRSMNQSAPCHQPMCRSLIKNEATTIRTRLCIQPSACS